MKARLVRYAARHLVPLSRIVRRLLAALPWYNDEIDMVILSIPKPVTRDSAKLEKFLIESNTEIRQHYMD